MSNAGKGEKMAASDVKLRMLVSYLSKELLLLLTIGVDVTLTALTGEVL